MTPRSGLLLASVAADDWGMALTPTQLLDRRMSDGLTIRESLLRRQIAEQTARQAALLAKAGP